MNIDTTWHDSVKYSEELDHWRSTKIRNVVAFLNSGNIYLAKREEHIFPLELDTVRGPA